MKDDNKIKDKAIQGKAIKNEHYDIAFDGKNLNYLLVNYYISHIF